MECHYEHQHLITSITHPRDLISSLPPYAELVELAIVDFLLVSGAVTLLHLGVAKFSSHILYICVSIFTNVDFQILLFDIQHDRRSDPLLERGVFVGFRFSKFRTR